MILKGLGLIPKGLAAYGGGEAFTMELWNWY
jgi:hypothetical protein